MKNIWMVWQNNRLVGYVTAYSQWDAYAKAAKTYGSNFYVEKPFAVSHSKKQDSRRQIA
jgi:hypothetical protein